MHAEGDYRHVLASNIDSDEEELICAVQVQEVLIGVYVNNKDGKVISLKVSFLLKSSNIILIYVV